MARLSLKAAVLLGSVSLLGSPAALRATDSGRRPANDSELRFWLDSMLVHHRFTNEETAAATGLTADEVAASAKRSR